MSTSLFDDPDGETTAKPPISVHPAFPAIVALWFAALLGMGSLVLPAVLIERLVLASGIAGLVPEASPPLGFTARALIAGAGALIGALLGLVVARKVAAAHARPRPRFARAVGPARRPISVHEELGGESLVNGRGLPVTRRRALAIAEDDRPSDFLYTAPLPGEDEPADEADSFAPPPALDDDPLELCEALDDDAPAAPEPTPAPVLQKDPEMSDRQEFRPFSPAEEENEAAEFPASNDDQIEESSDAAPPLAFSAPSLARRAEAEARVEGDAEIEPAAEDTFEPAVEPAAPAEPVAFADGGERQGLVQLVQRLGASLERRRAWLAETAAHRPVALQSVPVGFEAAPAEEAAQAMAAYFGRAEPHPEPEPEPEPETAAEPQSELEAGPETLAEPAQDEETPADGIAPVEPAQSEPAAAEFAPPRPSLLRTLATFESDEDEYDDDEALPTFTLPLRRSARALAEPAASEDSSPAPADEDEDDEGGYSSLLAMRNPFTARSNDFVRIEDADPLGDAIEPAVVFPGREPAMPEAAESFAGEPSALPDRRPFDPPSEAATGQGSAAPVPDADAALRAALATLQRMSGAA